MAIAKTPHRRPPLSWRPHCSQRSPRSAPPHTVRQLTPLPSPDSELEANYATIRSEMLALLDSERPEDGFQPEQEQLSKQGDWKQYTMYRRGRKNQYACVKTPRTCEIIDKFPEAAGTGGRWEGAARVLVGCGRYTKWFVFALFRVSQGH